MDDGSLYGLIGAMKAAPGRRDELIAILADCTADMPGCRSYVVAADTAEADLIWISEIWDSKESHAASLELPEVRAAIAKAMPIIAGFGVRAETRPAVIVGT